MSTFYVLPSRRQLGGQLAEMLGDLFPGLAVPSPTWGDLAEWLAEVPRTQPDVYVVFREDLPDGVPVKAALAATCGAEPGDAVVEVAPSLRWEAPRAA